MGHIQLNRAQSSQWTLLNPWDIVSTSRMSTGRIRVISWFDWASLMAQMVKNPTAVRETWVQSLGWEDPLEGEMATHFSILAWRIPMDRGAWWATYSPWGHKELDTTERLSTWFNHHAQPVSDGGRFIPRPAHVTLSSCSWTFCNIFCRENRELGFSSRSDLFYSIDSWDAHHTQLHIDILAVCSFAP